MLWWLSQHWAIRPMSEPDIVFHISRCPNRRRRREVQVPHPLTVDSSIHRFAHRFLSFVRRVVNTFHASSCSTSSSKCPISPQSLIRTTLHVKVMAVDPFAGCNVQIPSYNCTLETCCLAQSNFLYRPSYGGNLFFTVFFGVFIIPQIGLSIWYKTWGFAVGMVIGLALELVGYISRVMIHKNPFSANPFLM